MKFEEMSELQLDALREVGGIGAGHAATALSQLVDRPIELAVPTMEIVEVTAVPGIFGGPERLVGAVYSRMVGDITGGILFMIDREAAMALVDLMHGRAVGMTVSLGHEEEQLIRHVASILISAYLAAIARMAGLDVLPTAASLNLDMAGALLEAVTAEIGMVSTHAALVRTSFMDESSSVEAVLFFVPDPDGLSTILARLGIA